MASVMTRKFLSRRTECSPVAESPRVRVRPLGKMTVTDPCLGLPTSFTPICSTAQEAKRVHGVPPVLVLSTALFVIGPLYPKVARFAAALRRPPQFKRRRYTHEPKRSAFQGLPKSSLAGLNGYASSSFTNVVAC